MFLLNSRQGTFAAALPNASHWPRKHADLTRKHAEKIFLEITSALFSVYSAIFCGQCGALTRQILSLTYDRFFAEFLNEKSLVPLGLLALSTCVGLRYEFNISNLRGISWKLAR